MINERTTFADAFKMADQALHMGVRGVTDLMVMPGLINLDFADIRTVMSEMGKAMMGTGEAEGEKRAIEAAEAAISNPLLDEVSMRGACGVLINITGGNDMTLFEVDAAANRIREEVDSDANIIFGSTFDESMSGSMRVSVVATGIENAERRQQIEDAKAVASEEPAEPAKTNAAQASGWFPKAVHKQQPYPTVMRTTQTPPKVQQNPTANLRAETPSFTRESRGATQEERGMSIFDRVRGLAFSKPATGQGGEHPVTQTRRVAAGRNEGLDTSEKQRKDELGDVPAFMRHIYEKTKYEDDQSNQNFGEIIDDIDFYQMNIDEICAKYRLDKSMIISKSEILLKNIAIHDYVN